MRNNLTRFELIDKSCQASTYLNQARGVLCSMPRCGKLRFGNKLALWCAADADLCCL